MLGKFFDNLLHEDEDRELEREKKIREDESGNCLTKPKWLEVLLVLILALLPRLIYLFFITDPNTVGFEWYGDVYHHWQIAVLSKEIGFKQGFLRLWDLKGMEYYWGLLHPLVLIIGFIISGSYSILVPRMISVIFGSLAILMVYLLLVRNFNKKAAMFAAVFLSLTPVHLFSDTLGMQEPIGIFLLLLGIYFWPRRSALSGICWMLGGMVRSEYWILGFGLFLAAVLRGKHSGRKAGVLTTYILLLILYLKYFLDWTGNPIYPIYNNFFAIIKGDWFIVKPLSAKVQLLKFYSQVVAIISFLTGLLILWKRPKLYLLWLLGLGQIAFITYIYGFGAYLYGYWDRNPAHIVDRFWVDRLMVWPYGFLAIFAAVFWFYFLPKFIGRPADVLGILFFAFITLFSQRLWLSINFHYAYAMRVMPGEVDFGEAITRHYTGKGAMIVPCDRPALIYYLVYKKKIPVNKLVSQFYDPFFYYQGKDPYAEWPDFRKKIIDWLRKNNVELLAEWGGDYDKMAALENGKIFEPVVENVPSMGKLFRVREEGIK